MQVDIKVNPCVEDVEVLITAEKKTQFVNDLVEVIWDFDKHTVTTLTGYIDNRAYIIKVADILRIFALNQKVYIQTANSIRQSLRVRECFSKLAMAYGFILDVLQLILLGCIGYQSSWEDGVAVHRCWT